MNDTHPELTSLPPSTQLQKIKDHDSLADKQLFQQMNGSVIHLTIVSHSDIAYAIIKLSQYINNPNSTHMVAMKHLYHYLVDT